MSLLLASLFFLPRILYPLGRWFVWLKRSRTSGSPSNETGSNTIGNISPVRCELEESILFKIFTPKSDAYTFSVLSRYFHIVHHGPTRRFAYYVVSLSCATRLDFVAGYFVAIFRCIVTSGDSSMIRNAGTITFLQLRKNVPELPFTCNYVPQSWRGIELDWTFSWLTMFVSCYLGG